MGRLAPGLGRVSGSPGPLQGHTSGCVWCGKCLVVVSRDGKRLEMRVLTVLTRRHFIRPGHESSARSAQFIRRWGLLRESVPGAAHW
jgi:hypothetical protein